MKRPLIYVCSRYSEGDSRLQDFRCMSLLIMRRCSALVLCDVEPDNSMMDIIQNAQRYHIFCTTLDGMLTVQSLIHSSKPEINADM